MIQNLSKDIRECYRCADECRQLAETAMSELARADQLFCDGAALADSRP